MTDKELIGEILAIEAEMKTWGPPPRRLADRTPYQVAVVERVEHLVNYLLGNKDRPDPPPRAEWLKTCPPRDVARPEGDA